MFIVANRARKPINRLDDFYAAVAAGDEDALEIQQLVTSAGLRVARNTSATGWRPGEVIGFLGPEAIARCRDSWGASGNLVQSWSRFRYRSSQPRITNQNT